MNLRFRAAGFLYHFFLLVTLLDWSLLKNTRFGPEARYNVQFRAEFYNIFNHPALQATGATTDVSNPLFGQITQSIAGSERNIQFGMRFLFDAPAVALSSRYPRTYARPCERK